MEVKKICVLGSGTMGSQIAQLAATKGYEVSMRDIEDRFVQGGLAAISGNLKKFFVDKGKMTQEEADKISGRISGSVDLKEAVNGAQVVIECILENMQLKQQVFKELDEICAPETILASNTSSFNILDIGSVTKRQDKVIGMHFFNPVAVMKLIEVIRSPKTSDETYNTIKDMSANLGKEIITVLKDSPGFIVNRLLVALVNEAAKMLYDGIATAEDIDKAAELGLNHPMGPLKGQDVLNGIGITLELLDYMRAEIGDEYRACPLIRSKARAGETGVKAGKGFYDYSK